MADLVDRNKLFYCEKCRKTLKSEEFYTSNNLEKFPNDGKLPLCKKCVTMHVDNWNPDTYLWILQDVDVPYIPDEWNKLMLKYAAPGMKVTGTTILGRYLSKMKLKQHKDFRWKDTEFLQQMANSKLEQTMKSQGYEAAEIAEAIYKSNNTTPSDAVPPPPPPVQTEQPQVDYFDRNETYDDLELTDEDRTYLRLKWGKTYRPDEWVALEQLYQEMFNSYDIQAAGDINTLKLACKCSLKANQLLDIGDIDGAQKTTKMYDGLMKAGKWTAAQNKTDDTELVDSIGELVAICEKESFIPRYYVSGPQDHVDRTIEDLQKYTHDLIVNEHGLSSMMEIAIKQIEEEKERIEAAANATEADDEDKLFDYDSDPMLDDQDFSDFKDFQEELHDNDEVLIDAIMREG